MDNDLDFYEEYTINLTEEERKRFFRDNPDFMSDVRGGCEMERDVEYDRIDLVRERVYREIMRKITEPLPSSSNTVASIISIIILPFLFSITDVGLSNSSLVLLC